MPRNKRAASANAQSARDPGNDATVQQENSKRHKGPGGQPKTSEPNSTSVAALANAVSPQPAEAKLSSLEKTWVDSFITEAKRSPSGAITGLRLRGDNAFSRADYGEINFDRLAEYRKLRNLTHLIIWGVGGTHLDGGERYQRIPLHASRFTHLSLITCHLSTKALSYFIGFSKGLEALTYQYGGLHDPEDATAIVDPGDLWAMLDASSKTLTKLDLDCDVQVRHATHGYENPSEDEEESLAERANSDPKSPEDVIRAVRTRIIHDGKYPEFPNLRCLRIGIQTLVSLMLPPGTNERMVDRLPVGLEELVIRGYDPDAVDEDIQDQIEEVVDALPTRFPHLRVLEGIDELIPNGADIHSFDPEYNDEMSDPEVDWSDNSDGY